MNENIELIDASEVDKIGLPRYSGQKFGEYVKVIDSIVDQILIDIDKTKKTNPNSEGLQISLKKMVKLLGPNFENRHYKTIYNGIKYGFWRHEIVVNQGTYTSGNKLFILRRRNKFDSVSFTYQNLE